MALPTLAETKAYLRVETTAEDTVITDLLASALAWAEALIGKPIIAAERTMTGIFANYDPFFRHGFYLPIWPVKTTATVPVITDYNGDVVLNTTYSIDGRTGRFLANEGVYFGTYPYTVVATVGLSVHPEYPTKLEPIARPLILGLASILYRQRNPDVTSESAGGGEATSYITDAIPSRLSHLAQLLRGPRIR